MSEDILDNTTTHSADLKALNFPLNFTFKIGTLSNDFNVTDAGGSTIAYIRQKMFKFKEAVMIYNNDTKSQLLYQINADRIIDFNAVYSFTNDVGEPLGKIGRKGMKSLWKASYDIFDHNGNQEYSVKEENPWAKVFDTLLVEIPLLGIFTGYLFNPRYIVINKQGDIVARLSKIPSFLGRTFKLEKVGEINDHDSVSIMLGLMMMSLLERRRG
jgi:hypothetical protein